MNRLEDKIAIITGGASGMGENMVKLFVKQGATVIAADINEAALEEKWGNNANVMPIKLDVSSDSEWEKVVDIVIAKYKRIDILINNAGISTEKSMNDITIEDWRRLSDINGFGSFLGMKHVYPHMKAEKTGSIVNISSFTAMIGMGLNPYSASKGSVRAISRAAAADFGGAGIRVNAIFPGIIETPMSKGLESSKELVAGLVKMTPLARLGQPEDVANATLFLASDEASFITGSELVIDGGYSAR